MQKSLLIIFTFGMILYSESYYPYIKFASKKYKVSEYLICRVIEVESNWKKNVVSRKGAVGLMQITEGVYIEFQKYNKDYDIFEMINYKVAMKNAEWNIIVGTWYLSYLIKYFTNINHSISAYFWGISNIKKTNYNSKYRKKVLKSK